MLGGLQGDTIVMHGYPWLIDLLTRLRVGALRREIVLHAEQTGQNPAYVFRHFVLGPILPSKLLGTYRAQRRRRAGLPSSSTIASREFLRSVGADYPHSWRPELGGLPAFRDAHRRLLVDTGPTEFMEMQDSAAARLGLDVRHPYTDRRLAEYSWRLPGSLRFRDGWSRWTQRRAIGGLVPESIQWRVDKGRISGDFDAGVLRPHWQEVSRLASSSARVQPFIDSGRLREAYQAASAGDVESINELTALVWLEEWLESWSG
jgi:asparagine synthase (glutamine-hydrolysing)